MDFPAGRRATRLQRHRLAQILLAIVAPLSMVIAAPAQATPNTARSWGLNNYGQLGNGTTEGPEKCSGSSESESQEPCSTAPLAVSGLSGVTAVAAGGGRPTGHSLALLENGAVMAWGYNGQGQLGNGTKTSSDVPVAVSGLSEEATAIAASNLHSLALLKGGTVMEWGELASGGTSDSDVPVEVAGLSGVTAIAAGGEISLAVVSGGRVMVWGRGTLGNGTNASSTAPVLVCAVGTVGPCPTGPYLEGATAVSASDAHSLALLSNGTVVAWGLNEEGELGNGTGTASNVPVAVSGLSGVTAVSAGGLGENGSAPFSLALLGNGTVKAWGLNLDGELGDGTHTGPETCGSFPCSKTPVAVGGLSGVTAIAAHGRHSLALLGNGTVKAWGSNQFGTLGIGTSTGPEPCGLLLEGFCSTTPVEVSKLTDTKGVGDGDNNSLAFGPPPAVTKIKPTKGPASGGTSALITGTDLTGASAVKFGSASAASFTVNSATSITAVSPAEPVGVVDVTVTTAWGTSAIALADRFKFAPTVTGVSPNGGSTAGGTSVTVTGAGFIVGTTATKFRFGTALGTSVNCTSTTSCTVQSPAHAAGIVDVKATVKGVTSPKSRPADEFTYS